MVFVFGHAGWGGLWLEFVEEAAGIAMAGDALAGLDDRLVRIERTCIFKGRLIVGRLVHGVHHTLPAIIIL